MKNLNFIAGKQRSLTDKNANWNCVGKYQLQESVKYRDEEVLFGGVFFRHFGHALLDMTSRLWGCFSDALDKSMKIIFLEYDFKFGQPFDSFQILNYAGIDTSRVEILQSPTQFKRVYVPEEAIYPLSGEYKREFIRTYDNIRSIIKPENVDKVYLTRSLFKGNQCLNEEYYEEFFKKRGFQIVAPEQLSFKDQIALVSGAKQLVTSVGTMSHLLLFADPSIDATILNRSNNCILAQLVVDAVRDVKPFYVEAVLDPLPSRHTSGVHIFYPNRFFNKYLSTREIPFDPEELQSKQKYDALLSQFMRKWVDIYSAGNKAAEIKNHPVSDILKYAWQAIHDEDSVPDFSRADGFKPLRDKIQEQNDQIKDLQKLIDSEAVQLNAFKAIEKVLNNHSAAISKIENALIDQKQQTESSDSLIQEHITNIDSAINDMREDIKHLSEKLTSIEELIGSTKKRRLFR